MLLAYVALTLALVGCADGESRPQLQPRRTARRGVIGCGRAYGNGEALGADEWAVADADRGARPGPVSCLQHARDAGTSPLPKQRTGMKSPVAHAVLDVSAAAVRAAVERDGALVAYALGNFVFDQSWSTQTTQSVLLEVGSARSG